MSEPFWKGKICKELEGMSVMVTFKSGAMLTGRLDTAGYIRLMGDKFRGFSPFLLTRDGLMLQEYVESVELLGDPEYERIDLIMDTVPGDMLVTTSGNKYRIHRRHIDCFVVENCDEADVPRKKRTYEVCSEPVIPNSSFAYALRRKLRLPDKPGLWIDKDDDVWLVDGSSSVYQIKSGDDWFCGYPNHRDKIAGYAPFRPYKPEEDHDASEGENS